MREDMTGGWKPGATAGKVVYVRFSVTRWGQAVSRKKYACASTGNTGALLKSNVRQSCGYTPLRCFTNSFISIGSGS